MQALALLDSAVENQRAATTAANGAPERAMLEQVQQSARDPARAEQQRHE